MRTGAKEMRDALSPSTALLQRIADEIALESETFGAHDSGSEAFVLRVTEIDVLSVKQEVMERSPLLAGMVASSVIAIVGGMYDVESGAADFYDSRTLMGAA